MATGWVSEPLADLASPEVEIANVGKMGIENQEMIMLMNESKRASCLCMACVAVGLL
jgi:hypothetical protein